MQPAFVPTMTLVGLPDAAVKEAAERVQAAIKNSGLPMPGGGHTDISRQFHAGGRDESVPVRLLWRPDEGMHLCSFDGTPSLGGDALPKAHKRSGPCGSAGRC